MASAFLALRGKIVKWLKTNNRWFLIALFLFFASKFVIQSGLPCFPIEYDPQQVKRRSLRLWEFPEDKLKTLLSSVDEFPKGEAGDILVMMADNNWVVVDASGFVTLPKAPLAGFKLHRVSMSRGFGEKHWHADIDVTLEYTDGDKMLMRCTLCAWSEFFGFKLSEWVFNQCEVLEPSGRGE